MPSRPDLRREALAFADQINDLLNRAVTSGIRLTAVLREDGALAWVGYGIGPAAPAPGRGIPLTSTRTEAKCFLHVMHTLAVDFETNHVVVRRSTFGLYLGSDLEGNVFHYDYEAEPKNQYPAAHFQVEGESEALNELMSRLGRSRLLGQLHFPVSGPTGPSLADVVEFLVIEGLANGRKGWRAALDEHRATFHRLQLAAAVRRDPETARGVLREVERESRVKDNRGT